MKVCLPNLADKRLSGNTGFLKNAKRKGVTQAKDNVSIRMKVYKMAINRCRLETTYRSSVRVIQKQPSNRTNKVTKPPLRLKLKLDICVNLIKWNHNLSHQSDWLINQDFFPVKCTTLKFFFLLIQLKYLDIGGNVLPKWMKKKC